MTTTYFLTGSYNDVDNDFELLITAAAPTDQKNQSKLYTVMLSDSTSHNKLLWQTVQSSFVLCLADLDEFSSVNNITFYSKILTSSTRNNAIDKELEGFILNRLEF